MELRIWGLTEDDADRAQRDAKTKIGMTSRRRSEITNVVRNVGGTCPIRRKDSNAVLQDASYNKAWALYDVPTTDSVQGSEQ